MHRYRSVLILVLLVVVPLAAAALATRFLLPGNGDEPIRAEAEPEAAPPARKQETRTVLAAVRRLPVGTLLAEGDLAELDLPASEIMRGHIVMDDGAEALDTLRGHAVREALAEGVPLRRSAVVGPGQRGFLAAVLRPGTRAVTIRLGEGARHAGLIDPGDRVDVILTAKLRLDDRVQSVFARTILEDVRVLAVDRQVGTSADTAESDKQVKRTKILTATLEVSPTQADRLALGEHEGELSLAVRSLAGTSQRTRNAAVDLEELLSLTKPQPTPPPAPAALPEPEPVAETRRGFAAVRDLAAGTLLKEEHLSELDVQPDEVDRELVLADDRPAFDVLRGHAIRESVVAGDMLTWPAVVAPGQRGFLATVLRPGTRAVTIQLGEGMRHAGLIDPGDQVDVILTARLPADNGARSAFARTILEDVRVVAVDRQVGADADTAESGARARLSGILTATLEVSPAQAGRLALGEHEGELSLAVRSLAGTAQRMKNEAVDLEELLSLTKPQPTPPPAPAALPEPEPVAETRRVFVAARNLPAGTLLREEHLGELDVQPDAVRREFVLADDRSAFDALRGHAMRETVVAGEPLTWSAVVGPGQRGFLAAVLKPGTRAVTIRLGEGARHAALIDPGDHVDVILTATVPLDNGAQDVLTRRILENARVVAVDRQLWTGADPAQDSRKRAGISTATLEVSPGQADRLALGEHQGTLALTVRSLAAPAVEPHRDVVDLRQLLAYPVPEPVEEPRQEILPEEAAPAPERTVRVIRGDTLTQQTFPEPAESRPQAVQPVREPDGSNSRPPDIHRSGSLARASQ